MKKILLKGSTSHLEKKGLLLDHNLLFVEECLDVGCQYNCLKCFSKGSKRFQNLSHIKFSHSIRIKLMKEAKKLGAKTLIISGEGESFLFRDIEEIINLTNKLKMNMIIFTNGLSLNQKKIKEYFSKGVSLIISIDSLNEKTYDKLTRTKGNFQKAITNLKTALKISKDYQYKFGGYKIVPIAINTNPTVLTYNPHKGINEIERIKQMIKDDAVYFLSHITPEGNAISNWEILIGNKKINKNKELEKISEEYSTGTGASGKRKDKKCAYTLNGIAHYKGYWIICPQSNYINPSLRFPKMSVSEWVQIKNKKLNKLKNQVCLFKK